MVSTKNKEGMTLTELLVASILIGIVMLGVASFSVAIQQFQKTTDLDTILAMKAMTAMNYLVRDAYLTHGEEADRGIVIRDINPFKSICFRHNDGGDPGDYADDQYACYLFETNNNNRKFSRCVYPMNPANVPPKNANKCGGGSRNILLTIDPAQGNSFWNIQEDGDNRLEYIEFTISAIFDPKTAAHPVANPVYTLTTRVSPPALSR